MTAEPVATTPSRFDDFVERMVEAGCPLELNGHGDWHGSCPRCSELLKAWPIAEGSVVLAECSHRCSLPQVLEHLGLEPTPNTIEVDPNIGALADAEDEKLNGLAAANGQAAIRFRSPAEIVASADRFAADHPPLWDGYIVPSMITLLNGRFKGGKTTFVFSLIKALTEGRESFCGRTLPGRAVPVVYLTEEPDATLAHKVQQLGEGVRILNRAGLPSPRPDWATTMRAAVDEASRTGAELLVIDTFAEWAAVADENAVRDVQNAVEVLRQATDAGLAELLLHHFRKGYKAVLDDGEAGRGSTALLGAANVIVDLAKVEGGDPSDRQLLGVGHLPTTPDALVVRWTGESYTVISEGERDGARKQSQHRRVCDALPITPPGINAKDLGQKLSVDRSRAQKLAKAAFDAEMIERTGDEQGGYRYWQVPQV